MRIFDKIDVNSLVQKLDDRCPKCNEPLENDESLRFPYLDCPKCHFRIKVTTRNNDRMQLATMFLFLLGLLAFVGLVL